MSHVILSPLGLGLLLVVLRAALLRAKCRRFAIATHVALAGCLLLLTPFGANTLVKLLEDMPSTNPSCTTDKQRPLVLLGGGFDRLPESESDLGALTPTSSRRLYALLQSGLMNDERTLVISGGPGQTNIAESRVLRQLAILGQIKPDRIVIEERSTSTWENATETAKLLLNTQPRIALVTSALHMKRAKATFERQGFDVCPVSVDSVYVPPKGLGYWLPQSSALTKSEKAIHEALGVLAYKLR